MSFPPSKTSLTLEFQDEKYRSQFPWVLLAKQDLLRKFVQGLHLNRVNAEKGKMEYRLDLAEEDVSKWFREVAAWVPEAESSKNQQVELPYPASDAA